MIIKLSLHYFESTLLCGCKQLYMMCVCLCVCVHLCEYYFMLVCVCRLLLSVYA